ncbi:MULTISPECIES: hypothetical protein [unclassified Treponema]|uniref:hypothetical protein n=1 Tax=unclassified Treponema TaxID=2638727 RepID=UPI0020A26620|nr:MULTISPECIES: hypothetical protein [unclassified Treponema]UTC67504.1 hypothetical protein E4O06_02190 [Treponema sp. OMZ 789]UTC70232.1 hypothetical protein E4O01_02180 [Treponema sp. OMZ 790]UTC72947.1 hypothetical protein E4O02_02180 [Treponema sp. OMZ 791]
MVSVYRQYENSNFSVLTNSLLRREFLYGLKFFAVQENFMSEQGAVLRMRISLACVEARAVVIDAYIQTDGSLSYLFVLCSSILAPQIFSEAVKSILPNAVIEEFYKAQAEGYLESAVKEALAKKPIPFSFSPELSSESKNLLISLLIENKAVLLENKKGGLLERCLKQKSKGLLNEASEIRKYSSADLDLNVLLFQKEDMILSVPVFQVKKVDKDVFQKRFIQILPEYGGKKIYVDDVFCIKNVNLSKVNFTKRLKHGVYEITSPGSQEVMEFNLLVPAMYE